jgi:hypothetical protein
MTGLAQLRNQRLSRSGIAIQDDWSPLFTCNGANNGGADALGPSADEHNPVSQIQIHRSSARAILRGADPRKQAGGSEIGH